MARANEAEKPCEGCQNPNPWARHSKKERFTGKWYEECNRCFDPSIASNPDVYFRQPYWDENLCDYDSPNFVYGKGTWVTSKTHKAYLLKKLGVRESGDRVHGATKFDPIAHRHAMASLRR